MYPFPKPRRERRNYQFVFIVTDKLNEKVKQEQESAIKKIWYREGWGAKTNFAWEGGSRFIGGWKCWRGLIKEGWRKNKEGWGLPASKKLSPLNIIWII